MKLLKMVLLEIFYSICGFLLYPYKHDESDMRKLCAITRNNKPHPVVRQPDIDDVMIDILENYTFLGAITIDKLHVVFVNKRKPFNYVAIWTGSRTCSILGNSYQALEINYDPNHPWELFALDLLDGALYSPEYYGICSYSTRYRLWKFLNQQKPWKVIIDPSKH